MQVILSPAKNLNLEPQPSWIPSGEPRFHEEAAVIMEHLSKKSSDDLRELQQISQKLAQLNYQRNQEWLPNGQGGKAAALAFNGDVYQGLQAWQWNAEDWEYAQRHLLILSGLYGVLRPADHIQPYRLEMGTNLKVADKPDLYHFWQKPLEDYFKEELKEPALVNLASKEYAQAFKQLDLNAPVLEVDFKEEYRGKFRVMSFYAKRARGKMANFIIQNRLEQLEELKAFALDNYRFNPELSTGDKFVFTRPKP